MLATSSGVASFILAGLMTVTTKFLDLDAVQNPTKVVVKLNGKDHPLAPTTVEMFLSNTSLVESTQTNGDMRKEFDLGVKLLLRSFPTMEEGDLRGLTFPQLKQLQDFVRLNDGSGDVEEEAKAEAGANPPEASSNSTSGSSSAA